MASVWIIGTSFLVIPVWPFHTDAGWPLEQRWVAPGTASRLFATPRNWFQEVWRCPAFFMINIHVPPTTPAFTDNFYFISFIKINLVFRHSLIHGHGLISTSMSASSSEVSCVVWGGFGFISILATIYSCPRFPPLSKIIRGNFKITAPRITSADFVKHFVIWRFTGIQIRCKPISDSITICSESSTFSA